MAGDLTRATERAAIISLKADEGLAALVPAAQIDPAEEAPAWPFIRLDGSQAIPQGRDCTARAEVTFMLHAFAKPRKDTFGTVIESARTHAGKILDAMVEAIHNHAFVVDERRYRFTVRSTRSMMDGAERDAWHAIANVRAVAYNG